MKATKKIVGAACALVAAVALSAGSTFAWFSSNDKVEVTGMHLQAVVPDALFIKEGIQTNVATITDTSLAYTDNSTTKLKPATIEKVTGSGTTGDLWAVKDADSSNWTTPPTGGTAGTAGSLIQIGTFGKSSTAFLDDDGKTTTDYAKIYVMSVARINNKTNAKLNAQVVFNYSAATEGDNTYQFVRCGFLSADASVATSTPTWTSIANTSSAGVCDYDTSAKTVTFTYKDSNAVVTGFNGNTAYTIQFVVWFDGPDADCYVNNALSTSKITVKITYTVEDAAVSP